MILSVYHPAPIDIAAANNGAIHHERCMTMENPTAARASENHSVDDHGAGEERATIMPSAKAANMPMDRARASATMEGA